MRETASVICFSRNTKDVVGRAVEILNGAQDEFVFNLSENTPELPAPDLDDCYSWELLGSVLEGEKQRLNAKHLFGVLDEPIEFNWFSRTLHNENICFITTKDWEYLSPLPLDAYVAYEIVENFAEMFVGDINAHEETRGCMFDMVAVKPHISFKMRTADMCVECLDMLNQQLEPKQVEALIAMLEDVRRVAMKRNKQQTERSDNLSHAEKIDREFPFPIAYCFRSMQTELSYSRKWFKMLELYEVIIKYITFTLLSALNKSHRELPTNLTSTLEGLSRPSTGHWHNTCFALLRFGNNSPNDFFVSEFLTILNAKSISRAHKASETLNFHRNNTKGHGFVEEDPRYRALYEQNLSDIQILTEFVSPLSEYPLIKVGDGLRRRQGFSTFPAKILMGSHPIFPLQEHQTGETVDTDCLLYDRNRKRYLSLYPWLMMDVCNECHREVVFLYDKLGDDHAVMREYPTNHTKQQSQLYEDIRSGLAF